MTALKQLGYIPGQDSHRLLMDGEQAVVLVVDDDVTLLTMLEHVLTEDGYRVLLASSGPQAIEVAAAENPNLILMDAIMEGMTGFEASLQIHEAAGEDKPMIVMVTGLNDDSSVSRAYEAGAIDYITKPIHWSVLRNRVRHLVQSLQTSSYRKVAEARVRNANKMETVGKLTGGIAHDFNNILSSIIGYTELSRIVHPANDDKLGQYLTAIEQSGLRAKKLIQQMLTFCRGDLIEPKFIDVKEAIEGITLMLRPTLPSGIVITLDIDAGQPKLFADFMQLEQALMNLFVNARDAIGPTGEITVSTRSVSHTSSYCSSCHEWIEGDYLEIAVSDNGSGVDDVIKKELFVPFISTKKATSGTGLGLSVVDGIVHEHKGHILVESEADKGTTFRLLFPLVSEPVTELAG